MVKFAYQQIMNWGPSSDSFFFMSGDLMQPQKFVFLTKQGNDISELMHIHVNSMLSKKQQQPKPSAPKKNYL